MFTYTPNDRLAEGRLIYLSSDLSLDTVDRQVSGVASVLVNDINIEFSEAGEAVAIWGLCPHYSWLKGSVPKPVSQPGKLRIDEDLTPGVSIRVTRAGEYWPVTFDPSSGWLHERTWGQEHGVRSCKNTFLRLCVNARPDPTLALISASLRKCKT